MVFLRPKTRRKRRRTRASSSARPTYRLFAGVLLALTLSTTMACARFEPSPLEPIAEYDVIAARATTTSIPPAPRHLRLDDLFPVADRVVPTDGLTLAETNALALFHAPALVAARRDLRLQGAELLRAGLLSNPELFLGPRIAEGGALIFPASLDFEIPLGGRRRAEENRAEAEIDAARHTLLDREAQTLVVVRRQFVALQALRRRREILRDVLHENELGRVAIEELRRAGEADQVAVGLATLERAEASENLREAEAALTGAHLTLLATIGLLPTTTIDFVATPNMLGAVVSPPTTDHDTLLRHSRLRALQARYRAAEHGIEIEIARQYPSIRLGPDFEDDDGAPSLGLGLSVTLPIFDRNVGGIAVAEERRAAGREAWRAELLDLARREAAARAAHDRARSRLAELRREALPAATATERSLEVRRSSGHSSLIETLTARRAIAHARLREVDAMRDVALRGLEVWWYSGRLFAERGVMKSDGDKR